MKPIFGKKTSSLFHLFLALILSICIFIADTRIRPFTQIRNYMETLSAPFYRLTKMPQQFLDKLADSFVSRKKLEKENQDLRRMLFNNNAELLVLGQYKQENARLRSLLSSPLRKDEQKMIAQIIASGTDPYKDQLVIDKGRRDGVYEGQPVINDKGVVGQVIAEGEMTSRILLVCDATHALPIQVLRNDIRAIAVGAGCNEDLQLEHLPPDTDIQVGDILVTSGLGGRFPEGYPVAVVSSVKKNKERAYILVQAHLLVQVQRLRDLLLLWGAGLSNKASIAPEEVQDVAKERLNQMLPQNHYPSQPTQQEGDVQGGTPQRDPMEQIDSTQEHNRE